MGTHQLDIPGVCMWKCVAMVVICVAISGFNTKTFAWLHRYRYFTKVGEQYAVEMAGK